MRLLVTGASGLLGGALFQAARCLGWDVLGTFHSGSIERPHFFRLDVTEEKQITQCLQNVRVETVIHAAANTDLEWCERNKEQAYRINAEGTLNLARSCKQTGAFLVYVSTDYVFDGQKAPCKEDDEANPLMFYGLTKLQGENFVRQTLPNASIARTSMQFGWTGRRVNLATHIISRLRKGLGVQAITDMMISPSYSANVADMLLEIAERQLAGILHVSGASRMSRYEFASRVAEVFGLDGSLITRATSEEFQWRPKRPRNCGLDVTKATTNLKNKPQDVETALRRMREDENGR